MTTEKKKIWILVLAGVAAVAAAYAAIQYYLIYQAYSTVLSPDEAGSQINTSTASVPDIDPSTYATADDDGVTDGSDNDDTISAVQINGVVYTMSAVQDIYVDSISGNAYDDTQQMLISGDGTNTPVDSSIIIYGSVDNNGVFSND